MERHGVFWVNLGIFQVGESNFVIIFSKIVLFYHIFVLTFQHLSTSAPARHLTVFLGAGCQHLPPWFFVEFTFVNTPIKNFSSNGMFEFLPGKSTSMNFKSVNTCLTYWYIINDVVHRGRKTTFVIHSSYFNSIDIMMQGLMYRIFLS